MPTYEYECQKCHKHFDEFQKMTDPPLKTCPFCKGRLVRLISGGAGLIFKGSGFYITDYKKTSASTSDPVRKTEKKEPAAGEKTADKKSGGETATKTPEKKETKETKDAKKDTKKETKKDV